MYASDAYSALLRGAVDSGNGGRGQPFASAQLTILALMSIIIIIIIMRVYRGNMPLFFCKKNDY